MNDFPTDLEERIKVYLKNHNEIWIPSKHFIYIDCTKDPSILVFEEWNYKVKRPTLKDLGINFSPKK